MAKTKITKEKGKAPASYQPNTGYVIGVKSQKLEDKTLGFYSEHTLGEKAYLSVVSRGQASSMNRAKAHEVIAEVKSKWPQNVYTMFNFS